MSVVIIIVLCCIILCQTVRIKDLTWELEQDHILSEQAVKDLEEYYIKQIEGKDRIIKLMVKGEAE